MYSREWRETLSSDWDYYTLINKRILPKTNSDIRENVDIILDGLLDLSTDVLDSVKNDGLSGKKIRLSPKKTISLVADILNEIDPDLKRMFDDERRTIDFGTIMIYPKRQEKKMKRHFLRQNKYFEAQCFDDVGYRLICGPCKHLIVKCPLEGNVTDVMAIVHEVIHLYSRRLALNKGYETFVHKSSLLNETPSIYFEKFAADYLVSLGYDKKDVYSSYLERTVDSLMSSTYYLAELDILNTYQNNGSINNDNLMMDRRVPKIIDNLIELSSYLGSSYLEVGKHLKGISNYWSNGDKEGWINWWVFITDIIKDQNHFNYVIGRCYTNKLPQDRETINGMLSVSSSIDLPTFEVKDRDLFKSINGLLNEKNKVKDINKSVKC